MTENLPIDSVAHVIQLSVAPVFLLTGVGAMLGVLSNRLARVVDRVRALEQRMLASHHETADRELAQLFKRSRLIYLSIVMCTMTSLFISSAIVIMFLSAFFSFPASVLVAWSFFLAMASFVTGLLFFLREVLLATRSLRMGRPSSGQS